MKLLIAGLFLGLLGSMHCVGMCGPIALALPVVNTGLLARIAGILIYNTGRIVTYAILGGLFGLLGKAFILSGYQQALSITLGVLLLAILLLPGKYVHYLPLWNVIAPVITKLKNALGSLFGKRSYESLFLIGFLNGWLPCGLVYTGVAGAIAAGTPVKGAVFMMFFGAGTIPAMMGVSAIAQLIKPAWKTAMRKTTVVFIALMGVVFILRGMNLGVPYLSPQLDKTDCTIHSCCNKK